MEKEKYEPTQEEIEKAEEMTEELAESRMTEYEKEMSNGRASILEKGKYKIKKDYFFFSKEELPSELIEAINFVIQKFLERGDRFFVMPQQMTVRDEEQAKKWTKTYGKYQDSGGTKHAEFYDLSSIKGKEAFINNVIIGSHSHSWPYGLQEKFEELKSEK